MSLQSHQKGLSLTKQDTALILQDKQMLTS